MEIVTDVSAVMAVLLNEPERAAVELATLGHDLIAPGCISWEIGNALYGAIKRHRVSEHDALAALAEFGRIPIRHIGIDVGASLRIAAKYRIPAYDAYYLECARSQQTSLLTLDGRMLKVAAEMRIKTVEVLA